MDRNMMKHDMKIITSISPYQILQGTADVFLGVPCLRIVQSPLSLSPTKESGLQQSLLQVVVHTIVQKGEKVTFVLALNWVDWKTNDPTKPNSILILNKGLRSK